MLSPEELLQALGRLTKRDPEALATFIISLAEVVGPVGDQVRTFLVGDDVQKLAALVRGRIACLSVPTDYAHRHALGREIGEQLELIVDAVERWVLPKDPAAALELLAAVFERDGVAMEQCGDHHGTVQSAFQRAAALMGEAAKSLPAPMVAERVAVLVKQDEYGVRAALRPLLVI